MDEKREARVRSEKSPVGAAILSALFPGVGFFYIGNIIKGIAYILIFTSLIVLEVEGRGNEHLIFGLMIAGFYIFQIFDSYEEAKKTRYRTVEEEEGERRTPVSLFWAVTILVIGVFFQLAELDVITYRDIAKLWPIILIGLGVKYIYNYTRSRESIKGGKNE